MPSNIDVKTKVLPPARQRLKICSDWKKHLFMVCYRESVKCYWHKAQISPWHIVSSHYYSPSIFWPWINYEGRLARWSQIHRIIAAPRTRFCLPMVGFDFPSSRSLSLLDFIHHSSPFLLLTPVWNEVQCEVHQFERSLKTVQGSSSQLILL